MAAFTPRSCVNPTNAPDVCCTMPSQLQPPATSETEAHSPGASGEAALRYVNLGGQRCPVCRYDLRGLMRLVCPECGAALRLEVSSPQLKIGPWLVAVVSLSMGFGFDCVMFTILSGMAVVRTIVATASWSPSDVRAFAVFLATFATLASISVTTIVLLTRGRRRWARLRPGRQVLAAGGIVLATFLVHAAGGGFILWRAR